MFVIQRRQRAVELHPCVDCGETDAVVLEFDHLRDKRFDIGAALPYRNWERILAEIEKCEASARTATAGAGLAGGARCGRC